MFLVVSILDWAGNCSGDCSDLASISLKTSPTIRLFYNRSDCRGDCSDWPQVAAEAGDQLDVPHPGRRAGLPDRPRRFERR